VSKPRRRWVEHVARVGASTGTYRCLVKKRERRSHLGDLDVDDRIILKGIFKNWEGGKK